MASRVPKASKERPARKAMLVPQVLRAPLELLGLRWVAVSSPSNCFHGAGVSGCRVRGPGRGQGWPGGLGVAPPEFRLGPTGAYHRPRQRERLWGGICTLG